LLFLLSFELIGYFFLVQDLYLEVARVSTGEFVVELDGEFEGLIEEGFGLPWNN
jgi:hypothetical protein